MRPFPIQLTRAQQRRPKKPMSDREIKPGDIVTLVHDKTKMTVGRLHQPYGVPKASCFYFKDGVIQEATVDPSALRKVDEGA